MKKPPIDVNKEIDDLKEIGGVQQVNDTVVEIKEVKSVPKKATVFLIMLFLAVSVVAAYFYNEVRALEQNPSKINQEKVIALVGIVDKLIALPEGELPTVATISDMAPLANNPFFAKAKIGDKVLFYTAARRAFIYDPKANIIVEVASLNIGR